MARNATKRLKELGSRAGPAARQPSRTRNASPSRFTPPPGDDVRAPWLTFWLGAALIFSAIVAAAVIFGTMSVERDITSQAQAVLLANGFDTIEVEANGGDLRFTGTYKRCPEPCETETPDPYGLILAMVGGIPGVAGVDASQLYAVDPPQTSEPGEVEGDAINAEWSDGVVTLWGDVSSSDTRSLLIQALNAAPNVDAIEAEELTILEGLSSEADWIDEVSTLLAASVQNLPEGAFFINPSARVFSVAGETESRQLKKDLADDAATITAAFGFLYNDSVLLPKAEVTKEQVEELQEELDELVLNQVVEFELDSAALTASGRALLDDVFAQIQTVAEIPIEIHGHASADGTAAKNLELSERRAEAVRDYLVGLGADPNRFVVFAWGDTKPIASNATEEGRAKNRRIEFTAVLEES